ncbi:hypothetical protein [Entomomonas moraniae]|nr:hypothetical protein [Entomomonas moraniae]
MGIQNQMSVKNPNAPLTDFNVPLNVPFYRSSGQTAVHLYAQS